MKCARHPGVETNLACGKCGVPICPKCLIQTPVGARCPQCAAVKRLPVYQVPASFYLRAAGSGLAVSSALGALWPFIPFGGFFSFIIAAGIGYATGEAISLSVNRKRSAGLQVIAALSMVIAYAIRTAIAAPPFPFLDSFLTVYGLIATVLGMIVAVSRLR